MLNRNLMVTTCKGCAKGKGGRASTPGRERLGAPEGQLCVAEVTAVGYMVLIDIDGRRRAA